MVILSRNNIFHKYISQLKLNIFKYQLNQLAFIYCMLFLQYKMPSLPQAAFAVCKIREQQSKPSKGDDKGSTPTAFNKKLCDYLPVKYNEKFMNAIWGHYNRYSPHNIKSNDAAIAVSTSGKQLMAAAAIVSAQQLSTSTLNY